MQRAKREADGRRARVGAIALAALLAAACGSDPRPGERGETCGRTADCAEPLRCVDAVCTAPGAARQIIEARTGPGGGPVPNGAERPARIDRLRPIRPPDGVRSRERLRPVRPPAPESEGEPAGAPPLDAPGGGPP